MPARALSTRLRSEAGTVAVLLLVLGWLIAIGFRVGGGTAAVYVSDIGTAVAALAAAASCSRALTRTSGRMRAVWALVGASAFSWGAGQTIWSWYELIEHRPVPFPSLADAGFLAAVPFAVAGMLVFPRTGSNAAGRVRALVDGVIIAVSALMTSWVFVLKGVFRSGGTPLEHAISLAYPIGDVIVVTIVLYVLLRQRRSRALVVPSLIGAGFVAMSFSDSAFTYLTGKGDYVTGTLVDSGWLIGFSLLLVASLRPTPSAPAQEQSRAGGMMLPYVAVVTALVTTSISQTRFDTTDVFLAWLRVALIAALVLRQLFVLLENSSLTRRLEQRLSELRASHQRFEALVQNSSDVVTVVDPEGVVLYQSESLLSVFGHEADDVNGKPIISMMTPESATQFLSALQSVASAGNVVRVLEVGIRHGDGAVCHAEMTLTNLIANASVGGIVLNTRDMSERKALQDQLVHEASHDSLTSLANRGLFRERVEKELRRNDSRPAKLTILFLDLDGFKEVNDSLGHATGDRLLVQVGDRLRACVRPVDTVARLGGDEFAVLVADQSSEQDGNAVADRIVKALGEPFHIQGREVYIRASIGIAATDQDVDDADHLLRNADLAMYRAKANGAGGFERYHPRLHLALVERLQLEAELRQALANGDELELHYQPALSLPTREIKGVEALARWKHPRRGYVSPGEFIPLAEQTGLIRRLGRWGLNEACRQLAEWRECFPDQRHLTVSVNISGRHLEDASLIDDVQEALAESRLEPSRLVLEMTESVLMGHTEENVELLGRLKQLGVGLAIDDFGTGYSSLAYLHRFPADVIKIDRSFVERLGGSESDAELLRTIVQLGQSLRMVTVAEGVETEEQALALRQMGCELAQGFLFHRALPADGLARLFAPGDSKSLGRLAAA
ncbi:MAG TPA: EAL domain-containing protein [Gaiellaceae bacterium]|nr:EAL domain-containing protein [Gaiellaceae bacterium]